MTKKKLAPKPGLKPDAPEHDSPEETLEPGGCLPIRDRIIGFERIDPAEIEDHPNNASMKTHTASQKSMMEAILREHGIVDALIVYRSERLGGKWCAIDGHMRKNDFPVEGGWPCLITDLTDEEADAHLLVHDPVSQLAELDKKRFAALRTKTQFADAAISGGLDEIFGTPKETKKQLDKDFAAVPELPKVGWLLVGIPLERWNELSEFLDKLRLTEGVLCKTAFGERSPKSRKFPAHLLDDHRMYSSAAQQETQQETQQALQENSEDAPGD